ncbi:MAG: CPBP family glutamic-type intramembrane protease, partial [Planctomycetota bacterium]
VVTGNMLLLERFLPTTLMGLLLGWVAYRTGSVIPGMVTHAVHNGLLNLVGHYHKQITWFGDDVYNRQHLPIHWIGGASLGVFLALAAVYAFTRTRSPDRDGLLQRL